MSHKRRFVRADVDDAFSEGARLLWAAFLKANCTQGEFAKGLVDADGKEMAGEYLSKLLYGVRLPGRGWSAVLWAKHRIPIAAWDEKPKRAFSPPGASDAPRRRTGTDG